MAWVDLHEGILSEFGSVACIADRLTSEASEWRWLLATRERFRLYQEKWRAVPGNLAKKRSYMAEYHSRPEVKEVRSEYQKAYVAMHASQVAAYRAGYLAANRDRIRAADRKRRTAKRIAAGRPARSSVSEHTKNTILELRSAGVTCKEISHRTGASLSTIDRVVFGVRACREKANRRRKKK